MTPLVVTNIIKCKNFFRDTCTIACTLLQRLVLRYPYFPGQLSLRCTLRSLLYSIVLQLGSKISQDKLIPLTTISIRKYMFPFPPLASLEPTLPMQLPPTILELSNCHQPLKAYSPCLSAGGWGLSWGEAALSSAGGGFSWGEASTAPTRVRVKMDSFILKSAGESFLSSGVHGASCALPGIIL